MNKRQIAIVALLAFVLIGLLVGSLRAGDTETCGPIYEGEPGCGVNAQYEHDHEHWHNAQYHFHTDGGGPHTHLHEHGVPHSHSTPEPTPAEPTATPTAMPTPTATPVTPAPEPTIWDTCALLNGGDFFPYEWWECVTGDNGPEAYGVTRASPAPTPISTPISTPMPPDADRCEPGYHWAADSTGAGVCKDAEGDFEEDTGPDDAACLYGHEHPSVSHFFRTTGCLEESARDWCR